MRHRLIILFFTAIFPLSLWAEDRGPESFPSFETAYRAGIESYQKKEFPQAKEAFTAALKQQPESVSALTNLGLTYFQLNQKGWAIALLRRALSLDPHFSTPQTALNFILPQLEVKEIPHEIHIWESFREKVLTLFSLDSLLIFTGLLLLGFGWTGLNYFGKRKRALNEGLVLPGYSFVAAIFTAGFVFFFVCTVSKIWDSRVPRATVVAEKVTVRSLPEDSSPSLFDLYAGLEVIIEQSMKDWAQVTYPGGQSGWIKKEEIFVTTGKPL